MEGKAMGAKKESGSSNVIVITTCTAPQKKNQKLIENEGSKNKQSGAQLQQFVPKQIVSKSLFAKPPIVGCRLKYQETLNKVLQASGRIK